MTMVFVQIRRNNCFANSLVLRLDWTNLSINLYILNYFCRILSYTQAGSNVDDCWCPGAYYNLSSLGFISNMQYWQFIVLMCCEFRQPTHELCRRFLWNIITDLPVFKNKSTRAGLSLHYTMYSLHSDDWACHLAWPPGPRFNIG